MFSISKIIRPFRKHKTEVLGMSFPFDITFKITSSEEEIVKNPIIKDISFEFPDKVTVEI